MMKKIVGLVLAVIMVFSVTGCTDKDDGGDFAKITAFKSEETERTEKTTTRKKKVTTTKKEVKKPPVDTPVGEGDISGALGMKQCGDKNSPARLGQFVKVSDYSPSDNQHHLVYMRITKVTTETQDSQYVNDAITLHNSFCPEKYKVSRENLKMPSDTEICIVDYEVSYPADFPQSNGKLYCDGKRFDAVTMAGGGVPSSDGTSSYIGIGSTTKMYQEKDPVYVAGKTYKFKNYFIMVKGYDDYLFEEYDYDPETDMTKDESFTKTYFAHK